MSEKKRERVPTGVEGFDEIIEGGFLPGSINLVSGEAGTGKTMFATAFIANGALMHDENGLIITLEEDRDGIINNGPKALRDAMEKKPGMVSIFDISAMRSLMTTSEESKGITSALDVEVLKEMIGRWMKEKEIKRIAIDGVASIAIRYGSEPHFRSALFKLAAYLRKSGATSVLTVEVNEKGRFSRYGVEEFVGDSIILLTRENGIREIKIPKFRGSGVLPGRHTFTIDRNGIRAYHELYPSKQTKGLSRKKELFGIPGIDEMTGGGFYRGDTTLVVGNAGTGKTIFGLQFLYAGAINGEPGLFISSKESDKELQRIAAGLGMDLRELIKSGLLELLLIDQRTREPNKNAWEILNRTKGKRRLVIDTLNDYWPLSPETNIRKQLFSLSSHLKSRGVSSVFTMESERFMGDLTEKESRLTFVADNVILLKYVEIRSEIKKSVNILKMRGSDFDHSIRDLKITNKGIIVGERFEGMERVMSGTPNTPVAQRMQRFFG